MSSSDYPAYDNGLLQLAKISEIHSKAGGSWSALESSSFPATTTDSSRSTSPSTQNFRIQPPSTPIPNPLTPLPTPDHSNASSASSSPTSADFAENGDRHSFQQANDYGSSPPPSPSTSSDSSGSESADVIINIDLASLDTEDIHSSSDPKPKRKRANDWQLQVLNKVFDQVAFPTANVRKELAQLLGMTPRSVQIWFQNRRFVIVRLASIFNIFGYLGPLAPPGSLGSWLRHYSRGKWPFSCFLILGTFLTTFMFI